MGRSRDAVPEKDSWKESERPPELAKEGASRPGPADDADLVIDLNHGLRLSRGGDLGDRWLYEGTKRSLDLVLALVLTILLSPVLALVAALVKASSKGPVLFRQERIGRFGEPFPLLKFRTMVDGAGDSHHREHHARLRAGEGEILLIEHDPRVTSIGRFLREWSLDELPNLWNVVKGDMSLVGPRPLVPYELTIHDREWLRRLEVPPGVTGLAQINGRLRISMDQRADLDLHYVEHRSFWYDVSILLRTVPSLVRCSGH